MDELKERINRILYGKYEKGEILQTDLNESVAKCQILAYLGKGVYKVCLVDNPERIFELNENAFYPTSKNMFADKKEDKEKEKLEKLPVAVMYELEALTNDLLEVQKTQTYVDELARKIKQDLKAAHVTKEMETRFKAESERVDKLLKENSLTKVAFNGLTYTVSDIQEREIVEGDVAKVKEIIAKIKELVTKKAIPDFNKISNEFLKTIEANVSFKAKLDKEQTKEIKEKVEKEAPELVKKQQLEIDASILDVAKDWLGKIKDFSMKILAKFIPTIQDVREKLEKLHTQLKGEK